MQLGTPDIVPRCRHRRRLACAAGVFVGVSVGRYRRFDVDGFLA